MYFIIFATLVSYAAAISLPPLLGKSLVGTVTFELVDYSRNDPLAPSPRPRALMVSAFYPVRNVRKYQLAPAYTPAYGAFLDAGVGLPPGTAQSVVSRAYQGAKFNPSKHPNVLLFSPGYGNSRVDYTATLSNLASQGYLVIGIDHPYDTGFIDYPDGRTAIRTESTLNDTAGIVSTIEIRVQDAQFVLDSLMQNKTIARHIPGVYGKLKIKNVGFFGHSLGGATSASAMFADSRLACGVNMDGLMAGPVITSGLSKPFLLMNTPLHNRTSDPSWASFWENLRGWKLELTIEGSTHSDFSDQSVLYQQLRAVGAIPDLGDFFGTIGGDRMLEIENAYLGAFFNCCLRKKKQALLKKESKKFPEVEFWPA